MFGVFSPLLLVENITDHKSLLIYLFFLPTERDLKTDSGKCLVLTNPTPPKILLPVFTLLSPR